VTQLIYCAHPVSGDVARNVERALVWLSWLRRMHPDAAIIAPWIAAILSGEDDADPEQRARGLRDCQATAARCDGVVLVGPRISSGMLAELAACRDAGGWVSNLTALGVEPPESWDFDKSPLEVGLDVWRQP